jgi:hypothetical protein
MIFLFEHPNEDMQTIAVKHVSILPIFLLLNPSKCVGPMRWVNTILTKKRFSPLLVHFVSSAWLSGGSYVPYYKSGNGRAGSKGEKIISSFFLCCCHGVVFWTKLLDLSSPLGDQTSVQKRAVKWRARYCWQSCRFTCSQECDLRITWHCDWGMETC